MWTRQIIALPARTADVMSSWLSDTHRTEHIPVCNKPRRRNAEGEGVVSACNFKEATMAKTRRAKTRRADAKAKKLKRGPTAKSKSKIKSKIKTRARTTRSPVRKSRRKSQNEGIADKLVGAVQVVVDTIKETSELRRQARYRGGIDEG